jgi:hypothetical protein
MHVRSKNRDVSVKKKETDGRTRLVNECRGLALRANDDPSGSNLGHVQPTNI